MKTNSYTWLTRCCNTVKVTSRLYFFGAMWCIRQRIDSHSRCWQKIYILKCAKLSFPTEHPKLDHTLLTSFLPLCQCYRKLNQIFCYGGKNCLVCFSLNQSQSSQGPFRPNHSSPPIHLKEGSVSRLWKFQVYSDQFSLRDRWKHCGKVTTWRQSSTGQLWVC